jgi:hypothetical protein
MPDNTRNSILAGVLLTILYLGVTILLKNARELLNVRLDFANLNKQELITKIL